MTIPNETNLVDDGNLEVKIVPINGSYIIQIASEPIRGTLILLADIDEDELVSFSRALYLMIQHLELLPPQEGEVGQ